MRQSKIKYNKISVYTKILSRMVKTWFPTRIWSNMANELFIVHQRITNSETLGTFRTNLIYFFYHSPPDKVKINSLKKLYKKSENE